MELTVLPNSSTRAIQGPGAAHICQINGEWREKHAKPPWIKFLFHVCPGWRATPRIYKNAGGENGISSGTDEAVPTTPTNKYLDLDGFV